MVAGRERELASHWRRHYAERHARAAELGVARSLDYSNERVRVQTYASLLEGLGELAGRRVIDAGCGWGSLSLALTALGAEVVGLELVEETVAELRRRHPALDWRVADIGDPASLAGLEPADAVVAAEVLQYVEFEPAVTALWGLVGKGGRLVAVVPNAECPIARRVERRQQGRWRPVSPQRVQGEAARLGVRRAWLRGLDFRDDQSLLPYRASDWSGAPPPGAPNRLVFAWLR